MVHQLVVMGFLASPLAILLLLKKFFPKNERKNLFPNKKMGCGVSPSNEEECSPKNNGKSDVLIVGAGVAGSALAYALGKDGRNVHVIERDLNMHDRMVGEVLQPGGYLKLVELGLEDCVMEIEAQKVYGYVIYKGGKYVKLPYPLKAFNPDVTGTSFHNGRFVQRLRQKAASLSNVKMEEGTVVGLVKQKEIVKGVRYKTKTGHEAVARADLTIISDGYFSNLRRFLSTQKMEVTSHFVGWSMENCKLNNENYGHIIPADSSTTLVYAISDTETRCFIDIPGPKAPSISNGDMSHFLKTMVAPYMPEEIHEKFISTVEKGKMRVIPYWNMEAKPEPIPGAFLIGDAFNTRHPFSGAGMTVALSDVVVLRDLIKPLPTLQHASAVHNHLQSFYTLRQPMAVILNTMAGVLDEIFCQQNRELSKELNEGTFRFLKNGGFCVNAPMGLLSGLYPNPSTMLLLYFAVVFHNFLFLLLPFPSPKRFKLALDLALGAANTVYNAVKSGGIRRMCFPRKRVEVIAPLGLN